MRSLSGRIRTQSQTGPNPIANMWVGCMCTIRKVQVDKDRVMFKNIPARIVGKFDNFATLLAGGNTQTEPWNEVERVMLTTGVFNA